MALSTLCGAAPQSVEETIRVLRDVSVCGDLKNKIPVFYAVDYLTAYLKKYGEIELQSETDGAGGE